MKIQILIFILILQTYTLKSQILKSDYISNDTTWSSDTVKIYNDIVIENQATLQIDPGVYVEFQGNYSLTVYGCIKAIGSQDSTIIFTISDTTSFGDTTTLLGGWGSIKLLDNSTDTSVFSHCNFSYGKAIDPGALINDNLNEENMGGALFVKNYASLVCNNSTFYHNRASWSGGALWVKNCSLVILRNNTFKSNAVYYYGGGAILEACSSALISGNTFVLNRAVIFIQADWGWIIQGSGGGLRLNINCDALVVNNKFFNNHSVNGTLYETTANCKIYNNIVANNMGGGMMNGHGNGISKYVNNVVVNNMGYSHNVCGIYCNLFITMKNNIVWGNDVVSSWQIDPIQIYSGGGTNSNCSYSCIQDAFPGEGNITDYPLFVNPTEGAGLDYDGLAADWSLLDSSPCVNTGTPDTTGLNLPAIDLGGNPRVFGGRVDMGAYENQNVWVSLPNNPLVSARVQVSPNPFGQSFKVIAPGNEKISSISLFNQNGQQIATETMIPFEQMLVFDLRNQSPGLYLLVTRFADGNTETTKLVKY